MEFLPIQTTYGQNSKIETTTLIAAFVVKQKIWFYTVVMRPKDADGMAKRVDPDNTAPF